MCITWVCVIMLLPLSPFLHAHKKALPWSAAVHAPLCSVRRPRASSWDTPTPTRWCCSPHSAISADSGSSGPARASVDPRAYTCPSQSLTHFTWPWQRQPVAQLPPAKACLIWRVDINTGQSYLKFKTLSITDIILRAWALFIARTRI